MLNNYPAVAAEMYDSTLLDLAGDGRVAVAKESMAHLKNLVFDSPAEIQEVASPRWGTHSESTTGRHVRARLTDQNSNPQLAVSIGPADYSVSMATVPFLEPAWAGLEYLDLYVSATCSTLAIHPPWQECRLPRIGVMDPVIFDVTATAEGPWSVSLSFYNAGDLRLVEQVTVELPSEVLRVEPSGSDRLA
jgi:hypothetical protein